MKKNLLNLREGSREAAAAAFYGLCLVWRVTPLRTLQPPWNRPTKGGGNEGREEEEGSMNLGGGSSSPLSLSCS